MCAIYNKILSFITKNRKITEQVRQQIYYDTNGNIHHIKTIYTNFKDDSKRDYDIIYRRQHYTDYIMLRLAEKELARFKSTTNRCYVLVERIKANGDVTEAINTKYYKGDEE